MLARAKKAVLKELKRQRRLGEDGKPSPLEQAFLDASQQNSLTFDYHQMETLVRDAAFDRSRHQSGLEEDDLAYNDNRHIVISRRAPLVEKEVQQILMHECLHNTVEREGKRGNPSLSEGIEHTAMAMLGDRDEQVSYFKEKFNVDVDDHALRIEDKQRMRSTLRKKKVRRQVEQDRGSEQQQCRLEQFGGAGVGGVGDHCSFVGRALLHNGACAVCFAGLGDLKPRGQAHVLQSESESEGNSKM